MNKSFPTWLSPAAMVRGLSVVAALGLSGCAAYYPDAGYGTVSDSRSDDGYYSEGRPYYNNGGYGDGYYSDGYYGPAYGATTIYYERSSPGYYYRPGYGYYAPIPRHDRDHDHDHGNNNGNGRDSGWAGRSREITGDNPSRDRPHNRDDDRGWNRGADGGDRNNRNNNQPGNRPPRDQPEPRPSAGNDRGSQGWAGRGRQVPSDGQAQQRPQAQRPQPSRPNNPPPAGNNDRGSSRGGWAGKARSADDDH